jgi:hypothetical protein
LEGRQDKSFTEELVAAKRVGQLEGVVARLESELKVRDRELITMEAELKATHVAVAANGRHVLCLSTFAVVAMTALAGIAMWRR